MAQHHNEQEIFDFIVGDFQCAWDALAGLPESVAGHRGNFMFALQATILLEWLCRLCASDASVLRDFSEELKKIEPKYFTQLDDKVQSVQEFSFPGVGPDPLKNLLSALWDLIRNGNAHEYQDIAVRLTDGKCWALGLQGVKYMWPIAVVTANRALLDHLSYRLDSDGDLILIVHPGALFLDLCLAARQANLLGRGLVIKHLTRPRSSKTYQFSLSQLEQALQKGGHRKL